MDRQLKQTWPADQVERRALSALIPYIKNARTHSSEQIAQISASISEWGWTIPILIGEDNGIIAGHARLMAAQRLGLPDARVHRPQLHRNSQLPHHKSRV